MSNEDDVSIITSKIEHFISEMFQKTSDNSWIKWSEYVPKAIDELNRDIIRINDSRENIIIDIAELKIAVTRMEVFITTFEEYKEKVLTPLRTRVVVLSIIGGFAGGILAACVPVILKYILGTSTP